MQIYVKISGKRLQIIDHLPQNLLASAYAAAAVHVLPSWMETCGLVSLEVALAGAPLVGSTSGMNWNTSKGMLGMGTQEMKLVFFRRLSVHGRPVAIMRGQSL